MTPNAKKLLIGLAVAVLISGALFFMGRDKDSPQGQRGVVGASQ
jgi:hypothetical protein